MNTNKFNLKNRVKSKYFTKAFSVALVIYLLMSVAFFTIYSAQSVDFKLNDCTVDKNRLFTVEMTAKGEKPLSAASFEFTYDKSMFEFRSAKTTDDSSKISYNELSDKVKVVFLNTYGKEINSESSIFTLTFKAVKSGVGYIDFFVSDCVDSEITSIDAGKCTSAKITVNSKSGIDGASKNKNSDKTEKSDSNGSKSVRSEEQETTDLATLDQIGELNPFDNQNTRFLIIGIALGAVIIVIILIAYNIINRIKTKNKNQKDKDSSDK